MKMTVRKLIIWPRQSDKEPRVLEFRPGVLNLITGASKSGKSALIDIMDYCLGSGRCTIPRVGPIRRNSAWYGLLVDTVEGQKLLARREPGESQQTTDDYYLEEGKDITVSLSIAKNTTRDVVVGLLARLAQLPQSDQDWQQTGSGFRARASFRDMMAFIFQPQSIVASKEVMFYQANREDHGPKLREIFPLVLGVYDSDHMVKQHQLAELRRALERKRRELTALDEASRTFSGGVRGRYALAAQYGLVSRHVQGFDGVDAAVLIEELREAVDRWRGDRDAPSGGMYVVSERLSLVRQRESQMVTELARARIRLTQIREVAMARNDVQLNLTRKKDRLGAVSWLSDVLSVDACPICGSPNVAAAEELERVRKVVREVQDGWENVNLVPPMVDAEEVRIRDSIGELERALRELRQEREQLDGIADRERLGREQRAVFVGRLVEFLAVSRATETGGALAAEIAKLVDEEADLASALDSSWMAQRKEAALFRISRFAQHYAEIMELETKNDLIQLDTARLTIRLVNDGGQAAWMDEIGSGANWLGYHVATLLALHELFVKQELPYVPSVLVLDQPSQTQFSDDEDAEGEEIGAVRKAYEALREGVLRTEGALQIIVSDHAGAKAIEGFADIHVVERWRRGRKLIPWHWDESLLGDLVGKTADGALADIMASVVTPAVEAWASTEEIGSVESVSIATAVFVGDGISFEGTLTVSKPSGKHRIAGLVGVDLVVTLVSLS